jgi:hypothetical protein
MTDPLDGVSLTDRFKIRTWSGLATKPGSVAMLEAFDNVDGQWKVINSATASTEAAVDGAGRSWYNWVINSTPPRHGGRFWPRQSDGMGAARFRAVVDIDFDDPTSGFVGYAFNNDEATCTVLRALNGEGFAEATLACGVSRREVTITAPCDAFVDNGCWDFPSFQELQDFPFNRSMEFSNGIQGVAHDDNAWFFTSTHTAVQIGTPQLSRIAKIPVSRSLNEDISFFGNPYKPGHTHFGDPDVFNGLVFVPLEMGDDGNASANAVGFFSTADLSFFPAKALPADSPQRNGQFPWMARNPKDGFWYSSAFDNANEVYKYEVSTSGVVFRTRIPITKTLQRVQGGEFSAHGRLYVSCDSHASGAVNVIDFSDPTRGVVLGVANLTFGSGEELEGLTLWNLDDGRATGISGQIHVVLINNGGLSNDDWYFKHLKANPVFEL